MTFSNIKSNYDNYIMKTYGRYDVCFARGEGCTLYDETGRPYVDFASGIGVNSVGYAHPKWVSAVSGQAAKLAHVSNLYYTLPGAELAERLCSISGMKRAFFANSGAEANEGMIKCARKYSSEKYGPGRHTIVTLVNSFHGRTVTTLAATGQEAFHKNFHPLTEGFLHVEMGDTAALRALDDDICAVMVEPVQGEGGVLPCPPEFFKELEALCAERDWLLCVDEVQTGIGRCGTWFAYQKLGVSPDVVSFAKGIAGGLPLGGFLTGAKCEDVLRAGDHATTFGANPVCCAAALAVLDILESHIDSVDLRGERIRAGIMSMGLQAVKCVRGMGLMLGVQVTGVPREYVKALLEEGLVALTAGKDAIRFLPPLVITVSDIDKGLEIFKSVMEVLS